MKIGSLFSGIGGLELGLESAGLGETVWQAEIDNWCRSVLATHWPNANREVSDVKSFGANFGTARVDLICGGFPCQDVSGAGRGAGLAGERSGLWFEFLRIVRELAPRWVVVENVASGARRWLCEVRSGLQDAGYRTAAVALSAADVGAPHLRRRIFVVGYALRSRSQGCGLPEELAARCTVADSDGDAVRVERRGERGEGGEDKTQPQLNSERGRGYFESGLGGGAHGVPYRVDGWPSGKGLAQQSWEPKRAVEKGGANRTNKLRALGNSVVPQCAFVIGRMIKAVEDGETWGEVFGL